MFSGAKKNVKFFFFLFLKKYFLGKNRVFLGLRKFSNLNVLHKGLLMEDWVFRLGPAIYLHSSICSIKIEYVGNGAFSY